LSRISERWQKPFLPSRSFVIIWILSAVPVLWLTRPWGMDLPWYSKGAAILLYPFLATVLIYCPAALLRQFILSGRDERREVLRVISTCMAGVLILLLPAFLFNQWNLISPSFFGAAAVLWALWYLRRNLK